MAYDLAPRLRSTSCIACAAIAIAGAWMPSAASAQDIVTEAVTVPFAVAPGPYGAADVVVTDPYYYGYPAYRDRYAPSYAYPPAYGMICGYGAWNRWTCYPR
jgi:hypothetical protein